MKKNLCFNVHFFNSAILLAALLLTGCYDDKGNYDYTELAPMEITLSNTYIVPIGDYLKITPEVKTTIPDDDLDYTWELGVDRKYTNDWVQFWEFAKGKNLDRQFVADKLFTSVGSYTIRLHAQQKSTGRDFYSPLAKLQITGQTGLLVLHGDDNQSDIGLIVDSEFLIGSDQQIPSKVIPAYYSSANGNEMIPGKGRFVTQRGGGSDAELVYFHAIYAVTDKTDIAASYGSMKKIDGGWNTLFYGGLNKHQPEGLIQSSYEGTLTYEWTNILAFDGGEVFGTQGENPFLWAEFGTDNALLKSYDIAPFVLRADGWQDCNLFFDRITRGFIGVLNFDNIYYKSELYTGWYFPLEVSNGVFNPAHMNADLVWMGGGGVVNHAFAVLRRDNGSLFLAEFNMAAGDQYDNIPVAIYELDALPDMRNVIDFAAIKSGNTMYANYYATPAGVWRFTVDGNGTPIVAEPLQKLNGAPVSFGGEEVTMMKLEEMNGEQRMYVGTYNQSTKKGSVYTMTVDPTNGSVISDIHQYTGFNRVCDVFIKHM